MYVCMYIYIYEYVNTHIKLYIHRTRILELCYVVLAKIFPHRLAPDAGLLLSNLVYPVVHCLHIHYPSIYVYTIYIYRYIHKYGYIH